MCWSRISMASGRRADSVRACCCASELAARTIAGAASWVIEVLYDAVTLAPAVTLILMPTQTLNLTLT